MSFLARIAALFRATDADIAETVGAKLPEPAYPPLRQTDLDTLARTLHGEVRGEPEEGAIAVVHVIRNRAIRKGTNAATECLRPWQFSCWNANDPNRKIITALRSDGADYKHWCRIAEESWRMPDTTGGALHYFNPSIAAPVWRHEGRETLRVGGHVFRAGVKW